MDYMLKVVTADLKALSEFVNNELLPHESVQHVKSAIVLDTLKETHELPFSAMMHS
jgi:DNA-binding Lrp family transcriptional regulator